MSRRRKKKKGAVRPSAPEDFRNRPLGDLAELRRRFGKGSPDPEPPPTAESAPEAVPAEPGPCAPDDDFEALMARDGVQPLAGEGPRTVLQPHEADGPLRSEPAQPGTSPAPEPEESDEVLDPEVRELVEHLRRATRRPHAGRRRALREMPILDLHGFRADDARAELRRFLQTCVVGGVRWARVVTGRGRHTGGLTAVRDEAEQVLAVSPLVASYERAGRGEGGDGVLLVHLRRAPSARP